ncbi:MAG: phage tail tube protein [Dehalococcoidales bacterium]
MGADTNRVALRIVEESTPGTTPVTPAFQQLRITGTPNLAFAPVTVTTNEIRSDRQITDLILVGAEAGGDAGFELSASALDTIIEGAMLSTWVRRTNRLNSSTTQITGISSNVISVTDTSDDFAVDDLVALNGFGDDNDDIIFPAIATTDSTTVTSGVTLTDNASPGATATLHNVGVETAAGDIDATASPNTLTSTVLDFTTLGLTVGQWLKIGGTAALTGFLTNTANNDWVRVSAIATNVLTLDVVPTGWLAEANAAQEIWLQFGDYIINGTTLKQYSLEREFSDISVFEYFVGMAVNTLNFQLSSQSIVTATAAFLGFNATIVTSRFSGATTIVAPDETVVNTSSNIGRIGRSGTPITGPNFILEATIDMNNNLRRQNAVANLGAIGIGTGEFGVTGTLNTYFGDSTLIDDVINNTETSLDFRFEGSTGIETTKRVVLIDMPRVKYSSGAPAVPGKNQDVLQNLGYQAIRQTSTDTTMLIQQFQGVQI